ncbi:hypothetical protein [Anaerosalibacter sp. Marseille-P3206]|uniref:hypothetical protein n=1 Tax=Anaerosalibacter sp. Marseille-P3206 TaxID=1871005 RepID=UPI0009846B51|nr:hypothetical protein [Anaerosalibacter sp. Marseille-P3206]
MNKKLDIYFFGDNGPYDEFNPGYVCSKEFVPEILYLLAHNEPYSISKDEIIKIIRINEEEFDCIIKSLKRINAIDIIENKYKLNFPVFLEEDMPLLDKYFEDIGEVIGSKIIEIKGQIYDKLSKLSNYSSIPKERLLYHVICDDIFDGTAFDFFEKKNVFSPSKIQPGNRDYIIFGYEDSEVVQSHSNKILCSSNNYRSQNFIFNSFGDSDGIRKDMFRFFRQIEKNLERSTPFSDLNLDYIKIIENKNRKIAEKCGEIVLKSYKNEIVYNQLSISEKDMVKFLEELEYISINEEDSTVVCNVPVFQRTDNEIINEISDIILNQICDIVKSTFDRFEKEAIELTAIKHKNSMKEIAIELWYQVFGFTNEYLAQVGFVQSPEYIDGEGRYLRSFTIM